MYKRRALVFGILAAALLSAQDTKTAIQVTGAGIPEGEELRGKALTSYVLVEAQDGYRVLFSLAELDPPFLDNEVLVADTASGKPLSGDQGSFRLVVPKDKPGARSVRMLSRLEVVQVRK